MYFRETQVGTFPGPNVRHFCQKAWGTCNLGHVTINRGPFRCGKTDRTKLQSFELSGTKVISHGYARCHAFESCFDSNKIDV
jgi:hypothetical protein